jgi:hypothetical protein
MYVIYALEDPRNNLIFYVGRTDNLYERFIDHIRCKENNEEKNRIMHELKALDLLPIPRTLERVHSLQEASEREYYWVKHYDHLGMPLANASVLLAIKRAEAKKIAETQARKTRIMSALRKFARGTHDDSVIDILSSIGKRLKNGETPNDIRRSLGITGGRALQEVNAALQLIEQEGDLL